MATSGREGAGVGGTSQGVDVFFQRLESFETFRRLPAETAEPLGWLRCPASCPNLRLLREFLPTLGFGCGIRLGHGLVGTPCSGHSPRIEGGEFCIPNVGSPFLQLRCDVHLGRILMVGNLSGSHRADDLSWSIHNDSQQGRGVSQRSAWSSERDPNCVVASEAKLAATWQAEH